MRTRQTRVVRRGRNGQHGFTLIELLVVIAILSVLAAIVIFNVTGVKNTGDTAACNSDVQAVQSAVDAYVDNQPSGLGDFSTVTSAAALSLAQQNDLVPHYLSAAPTGCSSAGSAWGNITVAMNSTNDGIIVAGSYK